MGRVRWGAANSEFSRAPTIYSVGCEGGLPASRSAANSCPGVALRKTRPDAAAARLCAGGDSYGAFADPS